MRVSVVIVSRHRPALLRRCLLGLTQQDLPGFEVVVVADPAGIAAAQGFAAKTVVYDEPNISAARNLGIAQAAGGIVAFIDDDAVPEPTWLSRLSAPFVDAQVIAATGEDAIVYCPGSDYAANMEKAEALAPQGPRAAAAQALAKTPTPGKSTCADVADLLGLGQFLPGPNVINLSVIVGKRHRGVAGAIVAPLGLLAGPLAIVLGAEGEGMRQNTLAHCDAVARLPMASAIADASS